MDKFFVRGGSELNGTVNVSGSKNSSLPILAATLLTDEPCIIRRVPDVSDANYMVQILQNLGAHVERSSGIVRVEAEKIHPNAPYDLVRRMRASICVMGPLVARLGQASVSLPGGCVIGDRPVDLHLRGLKGIGAKVEVEGGNMLIDASEGLVGDRVNLRGKHGPTVLGTDNLMMAAVLAKGTTVIEGAAAEPEVADLADFLNKMGAKIEGAGTTTIVIEGVEKLHGAEHTVIPDRIEAGTYMVAGALAGGKVTVNRANAEHLGAVIDVLRECGHGVEVDGERITVTRNPNGTGADITTAPYPGFPTDMQAQMSALFAITPGLSVVTDTIFPERFMHIAEMARMGGDFKKGNGNVVIKGVGADGLSAAPVMASDLRASAALVLAALAADGETEINRVYHIDRGYEHIDEKLQTLGAQIHRVRV
ncbi:UDP-N-acetylglucosamine 1-carboxyvinyltransferase [Sulfuriroseicoccus oceanibius]|uniref:UDP-N-acetylglucosamine 1-carboxyvinyltransferase n=1 Tax=Sulfuriroseicoccus oceanibius TaxID=2707525 RepID=A0A6B3LB67_9BACT|nr:UDP-N-acetylglucosamine 1-carboxyvinyltransferase [Sulfuriroseicoccus oceanibius]QQL44006.1 UDP-N-acetylglucosamine 1-carboxyvinyltransferase [Sulfuriroseicoccus oceanibius]